MPSSRALAAIAVLLLVLALGVAGSVAAVARQERRVREEVRLASTPSAASPSPPRALPCLSASLPSPVADFGVSLQPDGLGGLYLCYRQGLPGSGPYVGSTEVRCFAMAPCAR